MEEVSIEVGVAETRVEASPVFRSVFDKVSSWLLLATVALLPLAFYNASTLPIEFTKNIVLVGGVSLATLAWIIGRLVSGRKIMPRSGIIPASIVLLVIVSLAAMFSGSVSASLIGIGNESGMLAVLASFVFALLLSAVYTSASSRAAHWYIGFLLSAGLAVFAVQLLQLFAGPFSVLGDTSGNLIGKWNDLAGFYGLVASLALILIELSAVRGALRVLSWVALGIGLVGLIFTNFSIVWVEVGVIALALLLWGLIFGTRAEGEPRSFHVATIVVLVISALFILFGSADRFVGSYVFRAQEALRVSTLEARPSWGSTIAVTRTILAENPVFGSGLNRFAEVWAHNKPAMVNETLFWNTNFGAGVGWIPTFATTGGVAAALAWTVFLMSVIVGGGRIAFRRPVDGIPLSLYLVSLYLWSLAFFYVPDTVLIALAFISTGVLVGYGVSTGSLSMSEIRIFSRPSLRFAIVLLLVLLSGLVAAGALFSVSRAYAFNAYRKGVAVVNAGESLDVARAFVSSASKWGRQDLYDRTLAEIDVLKLQRTVATPSLSQDELRQQFEEHLSKAIASARSATERDAENYLNWISLGRVYMAVVAPPFSIEGAYEFAKEALDRGLQLTPNNPAIILEKARLEISRGNLKAARALISEAIAAKSNFSQAHFLLSQLEATEGNLKAAIKSAEQTALLSPQDVGAFFQLGLLRYQNEDYKGAAEVLERAVSLAPAYSNARYFLGLSYAELRRRADAIAQFEAIAELNPDNDEVARILSNLRSGRSALSGVSSPLERNSAPLNE